MSEKRKRTQLDVEVFEVEDLTAFRERVDAALQENQWDKLEDEQQKALALLLRDLALRLLEEPADQWIPHGLIAQSNTDLAVVIHVGFRQLEQRVIEMRQEAERRQAQRRRDLLALHEELSHAED